MRADVVRSDLVRGLVWFVNYAALDPSAVRVEQLDLHNTGMLPADVELFAHRWLGFSRSVDIEHDGVGRPVTPVESFFNSPQIAAAAFPINSHAARLDLSRSQEAMDGFRTGKLNSVSLDALTFNRVVRMPAASGRSAADSRRSEPVPVPESLSDWALEISQCGYEGVVGVKQLGEGIYLAMRASGMPLAVAIDGDSIEVEPAAQGAWGRLGAALYESPSLTLASYVPVDHSRWSQEDEEQMLRWIGLQPGGNLANFGAVEREAFAAVDQARMAGYLPHHTVRGGALMASREACLAGLANLDSVPEHLREEARAHLQAHLHGGAR